MGSRLDHDNNFNLIRLVAAFQVMVVHVLNHFGIDGAFVDIVKATPGVPTFFFISGYLITGSYQRTRSRGTAAFFKNRILRIYPGLVACVLLSTAAVWFTGFFGDVQVAVGKILVWVLAQATIVQFYNPDFMRTFGAGVLNGVLWTITVELQFYVLAPLLYYLLERKTPILVVFFLVALGTNLYLHHLADGSSIGVKLLYVSFLPWVYMFLLGSLLAYRRNLVSVILRLRYGVLLLGYLVSMTLIGDYTSNAQNAINPLAFVFLACLIVKVAYERLPLPQQMTYFFDKNDLSYGLYLYHMPVINVLLFLGLFSVTANVFVAVFLSFAAASLSWYLIERPALRHKK